VWLATWLCRKLGSEERIKLVTFGDRVNPDTKPQLEFRGKISDLAFEEDYIRHVDGKQGWTALWDAVGSTVSQVGGLVVCSCCIWFVSFIPTTFCLDSPRWILSRGPTVRW
jgi:hypothetical protein